LGRVEDPLIHLTFFMPMGVNSIAKIANQAQLKGVRGRAKTSHLLKYYLFKHNDLVACIL